MLFSLSTFLSAFLSTTSTTQGTSEPYSFGYKNGYNCYTTSFFSFNGINLFENLVSRELQRILQNFHFSISKHFDFTFHFSKKSESFFFHFALLKKECKKDQGHHHQSLHHHYHNRKHHRDDHGHGGHDESFLRIAEVVAGNFRPFDPLFSPSPIQRLKVVFHHHSYNPPLSLE